MLEYKETPLWDYRLPIEERLEYLIQELTLEEKLQCLGTSTPEIPRLGLPAFHVGGEAAHGVQARHDQGADRREPDVTTMFPNPIGMSASWDTDLIKQAGKIVGTELRGLYQRGGVGSLSIWAPTVDMERDPRWGRTEEAYGEDPVLTGKMAGAYVEGIQGDDPFYLRAAATLKHFYANNVEEGRIWKSSVVDPRNKWEYYLEPFRQVILEHGAEAVMSAYNEINGIPAMLNPELQTILKDQWGLHHVVCDGGDVSQTVEYHRYYESHEDTIAAGLAAGVDCFTDDSDFVIQAARNAYEQGKITEKEIDRALRCHFSTMIRLGLVDKEPVNPYCAISEEQVLTEEGRAAARKMAEESVVLLKNDSEALVPLQGQQNLCVVGPMADDWHMDWYAGVPPYRVTPLQGLRSAWKEQGKITYHSGNQKVRAVLKNGQYLGLEGDCIVCVDTIQDSEVFELEWWDDTQLTIRALSNGKLLTVEDDFAAGQTGLVTASKREAFGWFVKEAFRFTSETASCIAATSGTLTAWNKASLLVDNRGRLCVAKRKDQAEDNRIGVAGTTSRHSVENSVGMEVTWQLLENGVDEAAKLAAEADTVVLCLGAHPMINCKEEIDRKDIKLPKYQQHLMEKIYQANPRVVLVMVTNVPFGIDWAKEQIPVIFQVATGGMELGNGLADVLTGVASPAGRLPMTWYSKEANLPEIDEYDIINSKRTYLYYTGTPLYPFGHGLTYSTIEYQEIQVTSGEGALHVKVCIANTGNCTTDEVVQIYGRKVVSIVQRPQKQLLDFCRVKQLAPGNKKWVEFQIPLERLQYYEVIQERKILEHGLYEISAGSSSENTPLYEGVQLQGQDRGVRSVGHYFAADHYDRMEKGILLEGCSRGDREDVWIPEGGYSFVAPQEGKTLKLLYGRVEIPDRQEAVLELEVEESAAWELQVTVNGMCLEKFQKKNLKEHKNTTKASSYRHKNGIPVSRHIYQIVLHNVMQSATVMGNVCGGNRKDVSLALEVQGDVKLYRMRII